MRLRGGAPPSGMLGGEGEGEGGTSDPTEVGFIWPGYTREEMMEEILEECFGPDTPGDPQTPGERPRGGQIMSVGDPPTD